MTTATLQAKVPAIFAEHEQPGLSQNYSFIPTAEVLDKLTAGGYNIKSAVQVKPRRRKGTDPSLVMPYAKHRIVLTRNGIDSSLYNGEGEPQLLLTNSHDGTSSLRFDLGFIRFICENGLVAGTLFNKMSLRHVNISLNEVKDFADDVMDQSAGLGFKISLWKQTRLDRFDVIDFVNQAMELRYDLRDEDSVGNAINPHDVITPRRQEDATHNVWAVFNVVQENLVKGRIPYVKDGVRRFTRPLRSLTEQLSFNKALWDLADSFTEN